MNLPIGPSARRPSSGMNAELNSCLRPFRYEPYAIDSWTTSSSPNVLTWSTDTFATNPNAHALRFATLFNFWFDADQPPADSIVNKLDLFKPGDPPAVEFAFVNGLFSDNFESGGFGNWSGTASVSRPAG